MDVRLQRLLPGGFERPVGLRKAAREKILPAGEAGGDHLAPFGEAGDGVRSRSGVGALDGGLQSREREREAAQARRINLLGVEELLARPQKYGRARRTVDGPGESVEHVERSHRARAGLAGLTQGGDLLAQ